MTGLVQTRNGVQPTSSFLIVRGSFFEGELAVACNWKFAPCGDVFNNVWSCDSTPKHIDNFPSVSTYK
jgi:hypothetical protein